MRCHSFVLVLAAFLVFALALGVAACGTAENLPGGSDSTSTSAPGPGTTSTSAPASSSTTLPAGSISHPTGATDVILRLATGGGLVPIEVNDTLIPEFTLYGDGRIIVPGPTTMQYPGAALPNLQTTVVSEAVIQAILSAAKEAKLFQNGVDYGHPGVADVGSTTVTVNAEGTTYKSEIYALGFGGGGSGSVSAEQQQARAVINDLRNKLSDPTNFSAPPPAWETYDLTALKVFSRQAPAASDTSSTDVKPNNLPWPLADLGTAGTEVANAQGLRQLVVTGDDLATLKALLPQATEITLWQSGNADYNLWLRPLLPDEAAAL